MSQVLKILETANLVYEGETILDAEDRGYFLPEDLQAAEEAIAQLVTEGWDHDIIALSVMARDFIASNNPVAVAHCAALLKVIVPSPSDAVTD